MLVLVLRLALVVVLVLVVLAGSVGVGDCGVNNTRTLREGAYKNQVKYKHRKKKVFRNFVQKSQRTFVFPFILAFGKECGTGRSLFSFCRASFGHFVNK